MLAAARLPVERAVALARHARPRTQAEVTLPSNEKSLRLTFPARAERPPSRRVFRLVRASFTAWKLSIAYRVLAANNAAPS